MKIWQVHSLGGLDALQLDEVETRDPGPGEIRLKVAAAGVNFADSLIMEGKYQLKPALPFGPGSEVAGEILAVGPDVDGLEAGQRVMSLTGHSGFAEEVVVPALLARPLPDAMPYEVAAGFPIVYGTSHVGLWHRARLQPGETLVVHGAAGGVGLTAVEIGKAMGARVIATASSADKLAVAKDKGADILLNSREDDLRSQIKMHTGGKGADVHYDPVGGALFEESLRAINFEGRILVIGFASGEIPEIPANLLLVKTVSVLGLNWGAYAFNRPEIMSESFDQLLAWYSEGTLKPLISETFDFADTPKALRHVIDRKAKGKVVVRVA